MNPIKRAEIHLQQYAADDPSKTAGLLDEWKAPMTQRI